jgi:hypothetical protein
MTIDKLSESLARDGFVLVPNALDPETTASLRAAVEDTIKSSNSPDLLRAPDGHVRKLTYALDKHPAFLGALCHPGLLGLALGLSPDPVDIVLTWEDVLVKPARVGLEVPVHQDLALQCVRGGVYSLGVHLDDAKDNPVWFLPGSHKLGPLTRTEIRTLREQGGFVALRPGAGDVIVHDVLVAHYSEANTAETSRYAWYLEFRTRAQLRRDGPWSEDWLEKRRAILFHAAAIRAASHAPTIWPPVGEGETRDDWLSKPLSCRVPHVTESVGYDLNSPYYHFD